MKPISVLLLLAAALPVGAAVIQEDFATDPAARGWRAFGHTSLFQWSAAQQNLAVTWDSSRSNSFFALPLGTVLNRSEDFNFSFDVRLSDIRAGSTPGKPAEFQIAVGLLNSTNLTNSKYFVGTGHNATYGIRNAVEFNYFPDAGFSETFATICAFADSASNRIEYAHNVGLAMTLGDTFRITIGYSATNQTIRTAATRNGAPFGNAPGNTLRSITLSGGADFRVDTFAIINYSDALQSGLPGSILAHGIIDNVMLTLPSPPVQNLLLQLLNGIPEARFSSVTNWSYRLERSIDLIQWQPASGAVPGDGTTLALRDTAPPSRPAFYRVNAQRP